NTGIVDEHIESAQVRNRLGHHALNLGAARHVTTPDDQAGDFIGNGGERLVVYIADEDFRAVRREGARKLPTDTRGAGRYQDTLRHDFGTDQTIALKVRQPARQRALAGWPAPLSHIKGANRLRFCEVIRT